MEHPCWSSVWFQRAQWHRTLQQILSDLMVLTVVGSSRGSSISAFLKKTLPRHTLHSILSKVGILSLLITPATNLNREKIAFSSKYFSPKYSRSAKHRHVHIEYICIFFRLHFSAQRNPQKAWTHTCSLVLDCWQIDTSVYMYTHAKNGAVAQKVSCSH